MRISDNMFYNQLLSGLQKRSRGAIRIHEQISSGRRINRLSDEPQALGRLFQLEAMIDQSGLYRRTIESQINRLNRVDNVLGQIGDIYQRVRELAVQGASDTLSGEDLAALAREVDRLINSAVAAANSVRGEAAPEALFERRVDPAKTPPEWVHYVGTFPPGGGGPSPATDGWASLLTAELLVETVDHVELFAVVEDPADARYRHALFFDRLFELRDCMQAGDTQGIRDILGGIDEDLEKVVSFRAQLGAKTNQLEMLTDQISFHEAQLTELKSILGDTDLAKASIELGREELVYKSLLAATTRLLEVSLLHFLR